jgi:hypothetical protein
MIETPVVIQGRAENGQMIDVAFSCYSGVAGVRDRGGKRVEIAYFRANPLSRTNLPSGEGTIGGVRYRIVQARISALTPAMAVITAEEI